MVDRSLLVHRPSDTLFGHPEFTIAFESATGGSNGYKTGSCFAGYSRRQEGVRYHIEGGLYSIERNGGRASEALAQEFDFCSDLTRGWREADKGRQA